MRKKVMTRQLAVCVPEDIWGRIVAVTDEEEISISTWIRQAIEWYLEEKVNLRKEI